MAKESVVGYILHTRAFKETSLLIDLFSREQGRFSLLAKGVKRKNSQAQRAILQPFNLLNIEYTGRSELKTLCYSELVSNPTRLPNRALACGYYMNELLSRSVQEWQEFCQLFQLYHESIQVLINCEDFAPTLRDFEVSLLDELGVAPQWFTDIHGGDICRDSIYHFIPEQGFELVILKQQNNEFGLSHKGFIGEAILSLGGKCYNAKTQKICQQITQLLLRQIIGDRPLESRKLWL